MDSSNAELRTQITELYDRVEHLRQLRIGERNNYEELLRNRRSRILGLVEQVAHRDMQLSAIRNLLDVEEGS